MKTRLNKVNNKIIKEVEKYVDKLLKDDDSGHDMQHINRVLKLSLYFAEKEKANKEVVSLIALLHDVDDHKLFGIKNSLELNNARKIMNDCNISNVIQKQVISELNNIGYSKRLKGFAPKTIEGKIVSDADMCDALGANGILRIYAYNLKNGKPFFDKNIFPNIDIKADEYMSKCSDSSVSHMFEKILKLKNLMLTDSGKEEAINRHKLVVDFLYQLFDEEDAKEWKELLDNYSNL